MKWQILGVIGPALVLPAGVGLGLRAFDIKREIRELNVSSAAYVGEFPDNPKTIRDLVKRTKSHL
jgi:hypothetical protein